MERNLIHLIRSSKPCGRQPAVVFIAFVASTALAGPGLQPYPITPTRWDEHCVSIKDRNFRAVERWAAGLHRDLDQSRNNKAISLDQWSREYGKVTNERSRLWQEDQQRANECGERVRNNRRGAETQRRESEQAQQRAVELNRQYERAKSSYGDAKVVADTFANPREELKKQVINSALGAERAAIASGARTLMPSSNSASSEYYNAAHDRAKEATIGLVRTPPGVGFIQDMVSDELKRRNNELLGEMERLDKELSQFQTSNGGASTVPSTLSSGTLVVKDRQSPALIATRNPFEDLALSTDRRPRSTVTSTAASTANPFEDIAEQTRSAARLTESEESSVNPFNDARATPATPMRSSMLMYRSSAKDAAVLMSPQRVPKDAKGDRIVEGKLVCTADGIGIVMPQCERRRKGGSGP